ncbi:unnamed protein product [Didymodactylos carnosus]|uniref:Uncharacterized protein n=1 Tax=Didymodactylos carnosus TaxID=1234261 RepID=A0A8S2VRF5_9BILA|nr:unnamed protein product [Didymodactylos carnosus]CAF4386281.1 unnamed protein product [Didymodactylos carnosus]
MSERCQGFSNTTDVGFGLCNPLSYQSVISLVLCICAANNCNNNFQTCKSSATEYQPPRLQTVLPYLSTSISCQDNYYMSNNKYTFCQELGASINYTACNNYVKTNTVLCSIWGLSSQNSTTFHQVAYVPENYEEFLLSILYLYMIYNNTSTYVESSSTLLVQIGIQNFTYRSCYCTTNNCNANLSTCTIDTTTPISTTLSTATAKTTASQFSFVSSGLGGGAIAGIVIGAVVGAATIGTIICFISYRYFYKGKQSEKQRAYSYDSKTTQI